MKFCFLAGMRNYVDKNYQDWANHKLVTAEDTIWLPPLYNNNEPPSVSLMSKKRGINWEFADKSSWKWLLLLGTLQATSRVPVAIE